MVLCSHAEVTRLKQMCDRISLFASPVRSFAQRYLDPSSRKEHHGCDQQTILGSFLSNIIEDQDRTKTGQIELADHCAFHILARCSWSKV